MEDRYRDMTVSVFFIIIRIKTALERLLCAVMYTLCQKRQKVRNSASII